MSGFKLHRLGTLMEPEAGNPLEDNGVLNPAAARGPDGQLYLFPRLVAKGNYSRIGIARVLFDANGDPHGVERMGIALEPEADYEIRPGGGGGCEDPRITFVDPLGHYVMTYTAFSPMGPRIALAISSDLIHWTRLGLATFTPFEHIEFDGIDNKDCSSFPSAVPNPSGHPALAILHRPLFPGTTPEDSVKKSPRHHVDLHRESIWISYRSMKTKEKDPANLCHFNSHHRLASPVAQWEILKIGCGTPPVLTKHGWMMIYHGVSNTIVPGDAPNRLCYSAGVMVGSEANPQKILYRSPEPVLRPELPQEQIGIIGNVVFPTGIDRRTDLEQPDRYDVYYGMADDRIGVARLEVPEHLPLATSGDGSRSRDHGPRAEGSGNP